MKRRLDHRERVLLALDHQPVDRVPIAMICSGINEPARQDFERLLLDTKGVGVEAFLEPIIDVLELAPDYVGPTLRKGEDFWGVVREPVSYGTGAYEEICHYPLAQVETVDELEAYRWPQVEWFDLDSLARRVERHPRHALMVHGANPFEATWYMRGLEQTMEDLLTDPDLFAAIMDRVTTFFCAFLKAKLQACGGRIDLVFTADDIAGQLGLLVSPEVWERSIKPYHARVNAIAHEFGARVVYHSDGAVTEGVPGLVEMGIDVLQALQFDCVGMDPAHLKGAFGDRIGFAGGVSVQHTLPFGSRAEVEAEVRARIDVLGRGGGYICGPSHAIQAGTPPENILAFFETAAGHPLG